MVTRSLQHRRSGLPFCSPALRTSSCSPASHPCRVWPSSSLPCWSPVSLSEQAEVIAKGLAHYNSSGDGRGSLTCDPENGLSLGGHKMTARKM